MDQRLHAYVAAVAAAPIASVAAAAASASIASVAAAAGAASIASVAAAAGAAVMPRLRLLLQLQLRLQLQFAAAVDPADGSSSEVSDSTSSAWIVESYRARGPWPVAVSQLDSNGL